MATSYEVIPQRCSDSVSLTVRVMRVRLDSLIEQKTVCVYSNLQMRKYMYINIIKSSSDICNKNSGVLKGN